MGSLHSASGFALPAPAQQQLQQHQQVFAGLLSQRFATPEEALSAVKPLAIAAGFVAQKRKKHPTIYDIFCSRAGTPPAKLSDARPDVRARHSKSPCIKCGCKWRLKVVIEAASVENTQHANSVTEWRIALPVSNPPASFSEGHNHAPAVSTELERPTNIGRIITTAELTEDIIANVKLLCRAPNMRGKALRQAVVSLYFDNDSIAVFEPAARDLLNNTAAKVTDALAFAKGDCQELIKELNEVVKAGGYAEYETTDDCSFKRAFWATNHQVAMAKEFGLDVIQQDCTFGTNKYLLPLSIIVGVNGNGKTRLFCQAVLDSEGTETFTWFLMHYVSMIGGHHPSVCFTDRDYAAEAAMTLAWPGTVHLICEWHFIKNVKEKLKGKLGDAWKLFKSHLRRTSRAPTEASFRGAWAALLAALQNAGAADEDVARYLNDTIYRIRERWAFCYRLGVLTLGINSTQRCEGYFGKLKKELGKVTTLCHLKHTLDNITGRYRAEDNMYMESSAGAAAFNVALEGMGPALRNMFNQLLAVARQDGTFYCFQSLVRQVQAAPRYSVKACAPESVLPMGSHAGVASELDPDAALEDNDSKRASVTMLHGIAQGSPAFKAQQWFTVEPTLGSSCHHVVIAASGAALCSCLETIRTGMLCPHMVACLLHVPVGTVGAETEGEGTDGGDAAAAAAPVRSSSAARVSVDVKLTLGKGQALGVIFDFLSGEADAVKVQNFTRSSIASRVKLPAEASGLIAIGDVIAAIDGTSLRCLTTETAKAVIAAARSASPLQTILTVMRGSAAGGGTEPGVQSGAVPSTAAAVPGCRSLQVARPLAMAVFRNTQRRWLRASVGSTAYCITNSDGKHLVLAKVVALAAQRFGAAAAGVVIADSDEAAAPDAVLLDNTNVIHANIFALFKTLSQEMKAMPAQQALELAKDLCTIGRNRIQGRVIDPPVAQKRSRNATGQRNRGST
eukprot:TRINITY_DN337_c0_g1_i5.p1 TRINITY_DN337_c0_g1~~TRINITY_DN337_c0_g1_i5.p1  ORF type:complete len:961 (-),score=214.19 TRINITY_DN337_c0_g1_i5:1822-4704(-)